MITFKTGDAVQIECKGRSVSGEVILASSNGVSLVLSFEGLLDRCHLGMMPVIRDEAGVFHSLLTDIEVKLTERKHDH